MHSLITTSQPCPVVTTSTHCRGHCAVHSNTSLGFYSFLALEIWLQNETGVYKWDRRLFMIARSDTKNTPQTIGSHNRCHVPSKTSGLYLRPDVYFFEMLANPGLLNETGIYLRETFIREYTLYPLYAVIAIFQYMYMLDVPAMPPVLYKRFLATTLVLYTHFLCVSNHVQPPLSPTNL